MYSEVVCEKCGAYLDDVNELVSCEICGKEFCVYCIVAKYGRDVCESCDNREVVEDE